MRLIDADALLDEAMERYCQDCDRRKGVKNGKWRIIYQIGDAPCRACSVDDMKDEIDNAPTAIDLVRCGECRHREDEENGMVWCPNLIGSWCRDDWWFCADGERRDDG